MCVFVHISYLFISIKYSIYIYLYNTKESFDIQ